MKKIFIILFSFLMVMSYSPASYAFKEDFGFILLDVPMGWKVLNKKDNEITLENEPKSARFIYKVLPVHNVNLRTYAEAIMQAYMGFNFKLIGKDVYTFNYLYLSKLATMRIHFSGRIACLQTTVGESDTLTSLINAGELQTLPDSFFVNPDIDIPEE